jgi:hypothetical protein
MFEVSYMSHIMAKSLRSIHFYTIFVFSNL